MDPKQMASLMRQMGIKNEPVDCERVEIIKTDGSKILVQNPQVILIEMKGQKSFQVSGEVSDVGSNEKEETDADLVMKETGCSRQEAQIALDEAGGNLAEAILKLKKE
ncbi:MAG TPA: nascent polypeptide-associated complex protein [Candidatus Norongarragalinales archaeon]|nr:nascent polypeptide-associated complex protein [Candidatus Norongarragalinales archaeon]